ncbi:jg24494 [Pararge aegeria aegeria]|uniref:Jg24494 protein n=1 Tax=Pararge aegeria aegeria TaxID=348720 RepID=A0A8S4RGW9_9NEOP|nr:jg24494 [Pararge aegeria aegeria]
MDAGNLSPVGEKSSVERRTLCTRCAFGECWDILVCLRGGSATAGAASWVANVCESVAQPPGDWFEHRGVLVGTSPT